MERIKTHFTVVDKIAQIANEKHLFRVNIVMAKCAVSRFEDGPPIARAHTDFP